MTIQPLADPAASTVAFKRTHDGRVLAQPENIGELYRFAHGLSRSGLIPDALKGKPDDVMVILMTSLELGVPLMAGLRQIAVIHGKPFLEASVMQAVCLSHPDVCEYVRPVVVADKGAVWEGKRRGWPEPYQAEYGPKEAEQAGLAGKDNYKKNPADMYSARACARVCRRLFPELVGGMYVPGEAVDVETENGDLAQRVAQAIRPELETLDAPAVPLAERGAGTLTVSANVDIESSLLDGIPDPAEV